MFSIYACHGLGIIQPIDDLAQWLRLQMHVTIQIVGNFDPQLEQNAIARSIKNDLKTKTVIFIGHSKGAMLGFYLPDLVNSDLSGSMIVTIDPTCWGSNINTPAWSFVPEYPGQWKAHTATRWLNFTSGTYPGGGRMINANETAYRQFSFTDDDHMSIVNDPRTRQAILSTMQTFMKGKTP